MQHLPLFAHRTCSSAAGVGGRLGSRPLLAAVALPPTSRRCAASSASRSPPRVTSSKNGRPKAMPAGKLLVKSKGELNLSSDYEDLGQPSRSPRANPASPAAGSFKAGAPKPKAKRSPHGKTVKERPRGLPVDSRLPAGTALELRDFVANKKAEERQRRLKMLERDPLTVKRNRWAWEWFGEGKELVEIGERVATLPRYASDEPYPPATVSEWIIAHLRETLAASEPVAASTAPSEDKNAAAGEDAAASSMPSPPRTHSLDRLTPELWARLSAPHPYWSTRSLEASVEAALECEDLADRGVWELLWSRGWRGEGVEQGVAKDGARIHRDGTLPISEDVLARFLREDERPAAEQDLGLHQRLVANAADDLDRMPESARLAMALERLALAKGQEGAKKFMRQIAHRGGRGGAAVGGRAAAVVSGKSSTPRPAGR